MGTLKACLAVVNDFTAEDFDVLEAKAKDYAGGKPLTNSHFIKAAKDVVATLKDDIKTIEAGMEPEVKVEAAEPPAPAAPPAPPVAENKDVQANTPVDPKEAETAAKRRLERLTKGRTALDISDEADIELAIEKGDFAEANRLMADVERAMRENRYRINEKPTGVLKADLVKWIHSITTNWKNAPPITIVQFESELPKDIQDEINEQGLSGKVPGLYNNGRVYLIGNNISSAADAALTLAHEATGHFGLRGVLGDRFAQVMAQIYVGNARVRALADAKMKASNIKKETAVEEVLSDMQEQPENRPLLKRIIGILRTALNKILGKPADAFTDDQVEDLLWQSRVWVRRGQAASNLMSTSGSTFRTAREAVVDMGDKLRYDGGSLLRKGVISSTFLRDLGTRFAKLAGMSDYVKATFNMSAAAADIQEAATKVQDSLNALPESARKELLEFMADATQANVVAEPTGDRNNDHLSTLQKDANGQTRRVYDPIVKEMQDRFQRLNSKQKAAYRQAREALAANWKKRGDLLARVADDIYGPLIAEAERSGNKEQTATLKRQRSAYISDINARLNEFKGDYFPMTRFGEYVVTRKSAKYTNLADQVDAAYKAYDDLLTKYETRTPDERKAIRKANKTLEEMGAEIIDPEFTPEQEAEIKKARDAYNNLSAQLEKLKASEGDYYMAQFESESEARRHAKEIGGEMSLKRGNYRELTPFSRTMLDRLEESLAASMRARGGNVTALRDAKRAMYEVFLSSLPERSALKRQAKRKNVAGFDRDMQRAIISTMLKDSFYLSRMEFADKITDAANRAHNDARAQGDVELQRVSDELDRRLAASMRFVDTPIQDAMAGIAYVYKLGVSPGYLIANMVQPFTVSVPMMMARHGGKASGAFARAWADTAKIVAKSLKASLRGEVDFENAGLPADEVTMLKTMLRERLLNVTMVTDLARTADGQPASKFASLIAKPSHFVEVVNRMSTALAAYRLEKPKTGTEAATKYVTRVLVDTHFDYSAENAPYWMKPGTVPMNKVLFQFKKYQAGMISLFVKAAAAMASGNKVAKREAMAQVTGMLGTHFAIGGVLGLPAVGALLTIANIVARAFGDDEPWDAEVALRNNLADSLGKEAGAVVAKGLPTLLGADMSQKAGLGDLLSPMPTLRTDKSGRDFALEIIAASAGPFVGGLVPDFFEAASYFARGDFIKGTEKMIPKWIADPIRAGRFAAEGVTTKQGTVALGANELSAWDVALQSAGVPSARITDSYEARAAVEGKKSKMNEQAALLKKQWLEAKADNDSAAAEEVWQKIKSDINPIRVRNGLEPITKSDLIRAQRERAKLEGKYARVGANANDKLAQVGRFALQ